MIRLKNVGDVLFQALLLDDVKIDNRIVKADVNTIIKLR